MPIQICGVDKNDINDFLENPPTEDEAHKAPTSEWAFDHNARDATAAVQGHATAAQITKLDGIEAGADVTDGTNVSAAGAVMKSDYDAKGDILVASADNTPTKLAIGSNGKVLRADSGETTGAKWVTPNFYVPGSNALSMFYSTSGPSSGFTALINAGGTGGLTATNVPYDGDAGELFLASVTYGSMSGKMVLWNTTRGTSRIITAINTTNNNITTVSSSDSWADNDVLTTQSQVNTQAGYFDLDISNYVSATSVGVAFQAQVYDIVAGFYYMQWHPYETYADAKVAGLVTNLASSWIFVFYVVPVISQKITMNIVSSDHFSSRVKFLGSIDVI
jgi:hypothetical protein